MVKEKLFFTYARERKQPRLSWIIGDIVQSAPKFSARGALKGKVANLGG